MLKYLREQFQKIDRRILYSFGALGGGIIVLGVIYYLKHPKNDDKPPKEDLNVTKPSINNSQDFEVDEDEVTFEKKLMKILNQLSKKINQHEKITFQNVKDILTGSYDLALDGEFRLACKTHRLERRKALKNKQQYYKLVIEAQKAKQRHQSIALNTILAHFKIDKNLWTQILVDYRTNEATQEDLEQLISELQKMHHMSLRNTNKPALKKEIMLTILKFKEKALEKIQIGHCDGIDLQKVIEVETKLLLIERYVSDLVYEEYSVEEEDMDYSYDLLSEPEKQILRKHYDMITDLQREIVHEELADEDEDSQIHSPSKQAIIHK